MIPFGRYRTCGRGEAVESRLGGVADSSAASMGACGWRVTKMTESGENRPCDEGNGRADGVGRHRDGRTSADLHRDVMASSTRPRRRVGRGAQCVDDALLLLEEALGRRRHRDCDHVVTHGSSRDSGRRNPRVCSLLSKAIPVRRISAISRRNPLAPRCAVRPSRTAGFSPELSDAFGDE
jgi:hypothetical protein